MSFCSGLSFDNYIDANLPHGSLQEEGINWLEAFRAIYRCDWSDLNQCDGGIKLMVHETQKERAVVCYASKNKPGKENHNYPHQVRLMWNILFNRNPSNWLIVIVTFLLGNYAVATEKRFHIIILIAEKSLKRMMRNAEETDGWMNADETKVKGKKNAS